MNGGGSALIVLVLLAIAILTVAARHALGG